MTLKEIYIKYNYFRFKTFLDLKLRRKQWDSLTSDYPMSDYKYIYAKLDYLIGVLSFVIMNDNCNDIKKPIRFFDIIEDDWYVLNPPPESNKPEINEPETKKPEKDPLDAVNDFLNEYKKELKIIHLGIKKLIEDL